MSPRVAEPRRRHAAGSLLVCLAAATLPAAAQDRFAEAKAACAGCHGEGAAPEVPALGGIDAYYALLQLVAFRGGQRDNEVMSGIVAEFSDDELRAAADWVDALPPPEPPEGEPDAKRMAAGEALAQEHRCGSCHGADYLGGHQMPPLRHQREGYVAKSLGDYKAERRIGDRAAMVDVATALSDEEIATLAYYVAHLD